MISVIFLLLALLYLLTSILILLGLCRKWPEPAGVPLKSASLIICARDEEADLPACLSSLEAQVLDSDSPPLEVILVDDVSRDRTADLMEAYARTSRHQVQVLHLPPPGSEEPSGKWRPLKEGMRLARNEGLLLTDADAVLPPTWVQGYLRELGSAPVAAGFARLEGQGIWGKVQSLDWLFLLGAGSAASRLGKPQGALGKNLAVRRADYLAAGGLEAAGFSLTEDQALIQLLTSQGGTLRFGLDRRLLIATPAVSTWSDFIRQRKRWASGIERMDAAGRVLIAVMGLRNFAIVLGAVAGRPEAWVLWGITAAMNFLMQVRITSSLGLLGRLPYFPLWEIFHTWTTPLLAVSYLINPKVGWKGRKFAGSSEAQPKS